MERGLYTTKPDRRVENSSISLLATAEKAAANDPGLQSDYKISY